MHNGQNLQQPKENNEEILFDAALNALAKALKAMNFYPQDHPLRDESISSAMLQIKALLKEKELVFIWSRDACTLNDQLQTKSRSLTAKSLAREMLTRKLQRLIILPELSIRDLKAFLALFLIDPAEILSGGGVEKAISAAGIKTIGANEVDLDFMKSQVLLDESGDLESGVPLSDEEAVDEVEVEEEKAVDSSQELQFSVLGIDILIGMLKGEEKEAQFLQLAREVIDSAEEIKRKEAFDSLLPIIGDLLEIYFDETRATSQREFIRYALEQITSGNMTSFLLDRIEERSRENETTLDSLCSVIGQSLAYPLIQKLSVAESLYARKNIATALTKSGEGAVPALVSMLKDERWYVVKNMVTILGEIVSPDSLKALRLTAEHPEAKVRKEVVKSLVRLAPQGGEVTLVAMLNDPDKDVMRQVIFSLGAIRAKSAVRPLLDIVMASDLFLKDLEIKKLAVAALGRIGDRQVTGNLVDILKVRGWFAPRRWLELKTAVATALGQIGDESVLPILEQYSKSGSSLGIACSDAADNIERVVK